MISVKKHKVFVIMPFKAQFFEVYEMLRMEFADNYLFSNAADEENQQNILKDIIQPIYEADVIIADLTDLNPNVMYELGIAHTFNKKTIIITQDELSTLPFDLKQYRTKNYSTHFKNFSELLVYLKRNIEGAVNSSVKFSNPVNDFIEQEKIESVKYESNAVEISEESDYGFLDFLAEIEEDERQLSSILEQMSEDMNEMTGGVRTCTDEIDRVNRTGGNSTAAFTKKQTKKAANYIESFTLKLRRHNQELFVLWDKIEKNSLGLLENSFAGLPQNKENLVKYLQSLYELKNASIENIEAFEGLNETLHQNIGIERSLNQAIRFVEEDLKSYIDFLGKLGFSIDKILGKSKFVVGDIVFSNNTSHPPEII